MTWYNKLQFTTMLLAVAGVIASWQVGLWTAFAFGAASIISLIAQLFDKHRIGNKALHTTARIELLAIIVYWLLLLISILYSSDIHAASGILSTKASLLIFPIAFLLTDTSWLGPRHIRAAGYTMLVALLVSFLYYCGVGIGKLIDGSSLTSVANSFDSRHHAYTALYLVSALIIIYFELYNHWTELPKWLRIALLATVPMFILYILMVNSRAGILALYVVEAFCVLHFAITRRRWSIALLMALLLAGFTLGMGHAIHGKSDRVTETINDMSGDVRIKIYKNDFDVSMKKPIVGYGAGDYRQHLDSRHADSGLPRCNAHNQYLETTLSIGLIGLAVLLFWLAWPLAVAWVGLYRRKVRASVFWPILMLTFVVAFNLMFESMLERQMGLLFIGPLFALIALVISIEQNKFGQLTKK